MLAAALTEPCSQEIAAPQPLKTFLGVFGGALTVSANPRLNQRRYCQDSCVGYAACRSKLVAACWLNPSKPRRGQHHLLSGGKR